MAGKFGEIDGFSGAPVLKKDLQFLREMLLLLG